MESNITDISDLSVYGSSMLLDELNIASGIIALELKEMRCGGPILNDDKKFERFLSLLEKASRLKQLSSKKEKEPELDKEEPKLEEPIIKPKRNIQDFVVRDSR